MLDISRRCKNSKKSTLKTLAKKVFTNTVDSHRARLMADNTSDTSSQTEPKLQQAATAAATKATKQAANKAAVPKDKDKDKDKEKEKEKEKGSDPAAAANSVAKKAEWKLERACDLSDAARCCLPQCRGTAAEPSADCKMCLGLRLAATDRGALEEAKNLILVRFDLLLLPLSLSFYRCLRFSLRFSLSFFLSSFMSASSSQRSLFHFLACLHLSCRCYRFCADLARATLISLGGIFEMCALQCVCVCSSC